MAFLLIIAHFSSQPFADQDLRAEIAQRQRLVQVVQKLPPVRFSYDGQEVDSRRAPVDFIQFWLRKGAHIFLYGFLGLVITYALKAGGIKGVKSWLLAGGLLLLAALLDERNQLRIPGRTGRPADVFLDLSGYVFFALVWQMCKLPLRLSIFNLKKVK